MSGGGEGVARQEEGKYRRGVKNKGLNNKGDRDWEKSKEG